MSLPRIRLESCSLVNGEYLVDEPQAHHLVSVLRCYSGALVEGLTCDMSVTLRLRVTPGGVWGAVVDTRHAQPDSLNITLLIGLLKSDQMEWALHTACELGVRAVVPLLCRRSVPKIEGKVLQKMNRWKKILDEATKQSGCLVPPELAEPVSVLGLAGCVLPENKFAAMLRDDAVPVWRYAHLRDVAVAVGPEGDWDNDEAEELVSLGFVPVGLGARVLRASTAAAAVCTVFRMWSAP